MSLDLTNRNTLIHSLPHGGEVVEVGVYRGDFSRAILFLNKPKTLHLIDAWCEQPGTEWQAKDPCAQTNHNQNEQYVRQTFTDEPSVRVRREFSLVAAATFPDNSLDIVYLDCDHTRAAEDIPAWWAKVKPGGYLCGHDYETLPWVYVQRDVDAFVQQQQLLLHVTREQYPSWAIQKPKLASTLSSAPIPVYINNRNRLTSTRKLVKYLQAIPQALPIIIDNASDYPPLLEWYEQQACEIIRFPNLGPYAAWTLGEDIGRGADYYAVTDADIELTNVPLDLLNVLTAGLNKYPQMVKAGLSLEISDLPQTPMVDVVREWEGQFWQQRLDERWWRADVDTTFALYRANIAHHPPLTSPAIRSDRPYTARHLPWYATPQNRTEEEIYITLHSDPHWTNWACWDLQQGPQYTRDIILQKTAVGRKLLAEGVVR